MSKHNVGGGAGGSGGGGRGGGDGGALGLGVTTSTRADGTLTLSTVTPSVEDSVGLDARAVRESTRADESPSESVTKVALMMTDAALIFSVILLASQPDADDSAWTKLSCWVWSKSATVPETVYSCTTVRLTICPGTSGGKGGGAGGGIGGGGDGGSKGNGGGGDGDGGGGAGGGSCGDGIAGGGTGGVQ